MLQGSSTLSEFRTSLSKVLTLWHCVKVKQRYLCCSSYVSKGREGQKEKNLFSKAKPNNLSSSDYFHEEEANIWYSSQAGLDSQPRWCKQKKGPKNSLVSPCREGTRKYGYFHMLRLPSKSLVESLRLSHKIGLRQ